MNDQSPQDETPYTPPSAYSPKPPQGSRSSAAGCLTAFGVMGAILLLLVIVAFGLFIGFCGLR